MVGSSLTLSLLGLGVVHALPASKKVEERQTLIGGGWSDFHPGDGKAPPTCSINIPISQQAPCIFFPIPGTIRPGKEKRQTLGPGWSDFHPGDGNTIPTCEISLPIKEQPPCIFFPIPGEIRPGKRSFSLPADYATNTKQVILQLEKQLVALQNKKNKTSEDIDDIRAIKAALKYLANIDQISASPGSETGFTPGKRSFSLPGDYASDTKKVILQLEKQLIALQNKKNKTDEDLADIQAIKSALKFLAGIDQISAPPGTETGFVPGKRDALSVGAYASVCPGLEGAEIALETLLHKPKPTVQEYIIIQKLTNFLAGCGIAIVKSPDGTWTIIKPSDKKRGVDTEVAVATLPLESRM
ncbi:hypothetical protein B0H65DRAFT_432961 [Neurospora tetraspora]|uniref:Uncharacterized protein n=1 Tax=Neurospora tetraspora TaxID=94610 RepID=A0AAE0J960_9PEZI|nr:hypothetical protein B0H65DRAFT_432961 [Neurospora tetraspora]